jgi:hypothetical protein
MALIVVGCTESERASTSAERRDLPADITCRSYGEVVYQGRSTGKVIYDEGGRVTFVDSANRRLTTIEGECIIVYARPRGST